MKVYLNSKRRDIDAVGEYDATTKCLIVKKGSKVSAAISTAPTFRSARSVAKYRDLYVTENTVKEDVSFSSASSAANFVTGSSTDGTRAWKNGEGESISSIMKKMEEH